MLRKLTLTITLAVASVAIATATAHAGDETPTPVATATSEVPELAAPTNLQFDGDALVSWTDNATGEDEYQVIVQIDGGQGNFSLPADSTSFAIPDFARVDCTTPPFQGSMRITVYATSLDLAGNAATLDVAFDCPQAFASPTAAPPIRQTPVIQGLPVLPATGDGDPGGTRDPIAIALLLAAAGTVAIALTLITRQRT
jgi:hypothetical protein